MRKSFSVDPEPKTDHLVQPTPSLPSRERDSTYTPTPSPVFINVPAKLTWQSPNVREVIFNKTIKEWMDYYPGFANWVRTCVMIHADNVTQIESTCRIPDQYREEIGETITITWDNCIPGQAKKDIPDSSGRCDQGDGIREKELPQM